MTRPFLAFVPAIFAPLALSACVAAGDFPSLAPRPAERERTLVPAARPVPVVPSDPALLARLAELRRLAAEGERAFEAAFGPAEAAVGRIGAQGSESWIEAQQAVSRLEAAREPTARALAELDRLSIDRADQPTNAGDFAELGAAIAAVEAIAAGQQQRLARLQARVS